MYLCIWTIGRGNEGVPGEGQGAGEREILVKIFPENKNQSQVNSFIPICCFQKLMFTPQRSYVYLGQLCHLSNYPFVDIIIKTQNGIIEKKLETLYKHNYYYANEETEAQRVSVTGGPVWWPGPTLFPLHHPQVP